MDRIYHDTVKRLQERGVDRDYIVGWMGGYLGNPPREEQRITDAWTDGYEDGRNRTTEHAGKWAA